MILSPGISCSPNITVGKRFKEARALEFDRRWPGICMLVPSIPFDGPPTGETIDRVPQEEKEKRRVPCPRKHREQLTWRVSRFCRFYRSTGIALPISVSICMKERLWAWFIPRAFFYICVISFIVERSAGAEMVPCNYDAPASR